VIGGAPAPATVRVVVVDDQAPFRTVARAMLQRLDGFELVGEATSGEEALQLCDQVPTDLVLMDLHLGGMDGIEATRRLRRVDDPPVVVLVSSHDPADLPAAAATCGASAYLPKDQLSGERLLETWKRATDDVGAAERCPGRR
jgi:DNA-binding NarL/FixJ family response regulator